MHERKPVEKISGFNVAAMNSSRIEPADSKEADAPMVRIPFVVTQTVGSPRGRDLRSSRGDSDHKL